jgi:hypothetical protein
MLNNIFSTNLVIKLLNKVIYMKYKIHDMTFTSDFIGLTLYNLKRKMICCHKLKIKTYEEEFICYGFFSDPVNRMHDIPG